MDEGKYKEFTTHQTDHRPTKQSILEETYGQSLKECKIHETNYRGHCPYCYTENKLDNMNRIFKALEKALGYKI